MRSPKPGGVSSHGAISWVPRWCNGKPRWSYGSKSDPLQRARHPLTGDPPRCVDRAFGFHSGSRANAARVTPGGGQIKGRVCDSEPLRIDVPDEPDQSVEVRLLVV